MTLLEHGFDQPTADNFHHHKASEQNDISRFLQSAPDMAAVRGLSQLIQYRRDHTATEVHTATPEELIAAMRTVQDRNLDSSTPNTYGQLQDQLLLDYLGKTATTERD